MKTSRYLKYNLVTGRWSKCDSTDPDAVELPSQYDTPELRSHFLQGAKEAQSHSRVIAAANEEEK